MENVLIIHNYTENFEEDKIDIGEELFKTYSVFDSSSFLQLRFVNILSMYSHFMLEPLYSLNLSIFSLLNKCTEKGF